MQAVRQSFNKAALTYQDHALWQHGQVQRLWHWCCSRLQHKMTIDIGCGSGGVLELLRAHKIPAIGVDGAEQVLLYKNTMAVCADMHHLPLATQSIGQIIAAMSLHWSYDLSLALSEWHRVITPDGRLIANTLLHGTFYSLRQALALSGYPYIGNQFPTQIELLSTLANTHWKHRRCQLYKHVEYFPTVNALMEHLKLTGCIGRNVAVNTTGLITPRQWQKFVDAYEKHRTRLGLPLEFVGLMFEASA